MADEPAAVRNGRLGGLKRGRAWKRIPKAERIRRMKAVAAQRWAGASKAELRRHSLMMVLARRRKRESA